MSIISSLVAQDVVPTAVEEEASARDLGPELEFNYHDYEQLTRYLRAVSAKYPALTALYSIGKSVQGGFVETTFQLF